MVYCLIRYTAGTWSLILSDNQSRKWKNTFFLQYHSNVSWQVLRVRYSKLDSHSSILENFEDRGSRRVSRRSRPFENLSRPLENLSSRVSRLSSGENKGLFVQLTFDTSEYFFTGRSIQVLNTYKFLAEFCDKIRYGAFLYLIYFSECFLDEFYKILAKKTCNYSMQGFQI